MNVIVINGPMDRIIQEKMHIKYYVRYMDDVILIHESNEGFCAF